MVQIDEDTRLTGTVLKFQAMRGFGFIKPSDGGKEIFVHWEQIRTSSRWPRLERDTEVEYSLGTEDDGRQAAYNVTLEGGMEIELEDEAENRKLSSFRVQGTVKFFLKKGYGFITSKKAITWPMKLPAGSDIYVRREDLEIAEDSLCRLYEGMEVEFNVYKKEGKEGVAAANVTEPGGEAITVAKGDGDSKGKGKGKTGGKTNSKGSGGKAGGKSGGVQRTIAKAPVKVFQPQSWSKGGGKSAAPKVVAPKVVAPKVQTQSWAKGGKSQGGKSQGKGKGKW